SAPIATHRPLVLTTSRCYIGRRKGKAPMPNQPNPNIVQIGLRGTKDLRRRLKAAAKKSGRSDNAEMVERLENSFRREAADEVLDRAQHHLNEAKRIQDQVHSIIADIEKDMRAGLSADDIFGPINALSKRRKR